MSLLQSYESEFSAIVAEMTRKITTVPDLMGEEKDREISSIEKDLDDAHDLLEQMELEVMDLPSNKRGDVKKRLSGYKSSLDTAERDLKRAQVSYGGQAARDELFGDDVDDQRAALLSNTDRLDRTSRRLDAGHRVAQETEEIAIGIMADLHDQRETIERSRGRLRGIDTDISKSGKILNRMIYRAKQNKVATFLIIFIGIGLIALIGFLIATK